MGTRGVVTAGHYLAAAAGFRIMEQGGNAVDAAAGMCICLNLLEPQSCGIGGEVPTLVYSAKERKTYAVSGMGWSPQAFTHRLVPRKTASTSSPATATCPSPCPPVVDTWALALARFGTMSYSQVLRPAIHIAEHGFPVYEGLHNSLASGQAKYTDLYPTTGQVYYPEGRVPEVGEVLRNPDFAEMLKTMCRAEEAAAGRGRVGRNRGRPRRLLQGPHRRAHRRLHPRQPRRGRQRRGPHRPALIRGHGGLARRAGGPRHLQLPRPRRRKVPHLDPGPGLPPAASHPPGLRPPRPRPQLPRLPPTPSPESAKLAFADREAYYGDPKFDDVPMDVLLSDSYSAARRDLIGDTASMDMRPGDVGNGIPEYATIPVADDNRRAPWESTPARSATSASATPTWATPHTWTPSIARATWSRPPPAAAGLAPRPSYRASASPWAPVARCSTSTPAAPTPARPGSAPAPPSPRPWPPATASQSWSSAPPAATARTSGPSSSSSTHVDFGMDLQQALDAPTVHTTHFPSSFYPRVSFPGRLGRRKPHPPRRNLRPRSPRPRSHPHRPLVQRQGPRHPPRPPPRHHLRRRLPQGQHRLHNSLVTPSSFPRRREPSNCVEGQAY